MIKKGLLMCGLSIMLSVTPISAVIMTGMETTAYAEDGDFDIEDGVLKKYTGNGGDVVIPEGVTTITMSAFFCCSSVTGVHIPASVEEIWCPIASGTPFIAGPFAGCTNLSKITVDPKNTVYSSKNDCNAIIQVNQETGENILVVGCKNTVIPADTTVISDFAFGAGAPEELIIPDGVKKLGQGSISSARVEIPASVTSLGYNWGPHTEWVGSMLHFKYFHLPAFGSEVKDIYFRGTEQQWDEINSFGDDKAPGAEVHFEQKLTHEHVVVDDPAIPATYLAAGKTEGSHCQLCGKVFVAQKSISKKPIGFTDVKLGGWQETAVRYMLEYGLMSGKTATTFDPNTAMNRGQLVTVLWNMEGKPKTTGALSFSDVPTTNTFYKAILWASQNKIVNGYATGEFKPKDLLTRQQIATILMNYAKYKGIMIVNKIDISSFKDVAQVSKTMTAAMQWAVGNKIISGKSNGTMLDPKGQATRVEVAAMIMNFCKNIR